VAAPEFHELTVDDVTPLTADAVAVSFSVPESLADTFRYLPGQHVTLRAEIDGADVRRSYSICANANRGTLRVGIKHLEGGAFSTFANRRLRAGDRLDVMPPTGEFTITPVAGRARHYGAIVAGSGITPVLSLISTVLETEPASTFTLMFGNRESRSIMFLEELEGVKDRHPDRFHLIHVLSREPSAVPLFTGRVDAAKVEELLDSIVDADTVDDWYLCGPYGVVEDARKVLTARGIAEDRINDELFFSEPLPEPPPAPAPEDQSGFAGVVFTLDGRASRVAVDPDGPPILDYALQVRREVPFSCRGGMCTTCKAKVDEGSAVLDQNWALTQEELDAGFILTCQAHPTTDTLEISYDV
jgi:ring-1,2-phenylacetyl-CoA epoxidase subunit PaaE